MPLTRIEEIHRISRRLIETLNEAIRRVRSGSFSVIGSAMTEHGYRREATTWLRRSDYTIGSLVVRYTRAGEYLNV